MFFYFHDAFLWFVYGVPMMLLPLFWTFYGLSCCFLYFYDCPTVFCFILFDLRLVFLMIVSLYRFFLSEHTSDSAANQVRGMAEPPRCSNDRLPISVLLLWFSYYNVPMIFRRFPWSLQAFKPYGDGTVHIPGDGTVHIPGDGTYTSPATATAIALQEASCNAISRWTLFFEIGLQEASCAPKNAQRFPGGTIPLTAKNQIVPPGNSWAFLGAQEASCNPISEKRVHREIALQL
jgi:hypothetical protein